MELHEAMVAGDLTTLRLTRRGDEGAPKATFQLALSHLWDADLDWSAYGRAFQHDELPCTTPRHLDDAEARARVQELGGSTALAKLERLLRLGGHEMVVLHVHAGLRMRPCLYVHSSRMGTRNGHHAIRAGGVRRHEWSEPECEVFVDGSNLARGMSFKNAAARVPFGGAKMTVQCEPFALTDQVRLGFLAWSIDSGCFFTGPDMGFPIELADALRARFTRNIVGGAKGAIGPTGAPTAGGTFMALRECAAFAFGTASANPLAGRRAAIQGLGAVGLPLAHLMRAAEMSLTVADSDVARIELARAELGEIEIVAPERILTRPCDVLAPCAIGGILDEEAIDSLACRILCGSANNQLRAVSRSDEERLAARILKRGIVYTPEWSHNIAGVVAGLEEYLHQDEACLDRITPHLERVCRDGTRDLLERARATGLTPTDLMYADVEHRIARGALPDQR